MITLEQYNNLVDGVNSAQISGAGTTLVDRNTAGTTITKGAQTDAWAAGTPRGLSNLSWPGLSGFPGSLGWGPINARALDVGLNNDIVVGAANGETLRDDALLYRYTNNGVGKWAVAKSGVSGIGALAINQAASDTSYTYALSRANTGVSDLLVLDADGVQDYFVSGIINWVAASSPATGRVKKALSDTVAHASGHFYVIGQAPSLFGGGNPTPDNFYKIKKSDGTIIWSLYGHSGPGFNTGGNGRDIAFDGTDLYICGDWDDANTGYVTDARVKRVTTGGATTWAVLQPAFDPIGIVEFGTVLYVVGGLGGPVQLAQLDKSDGSQNWAVSISDTALVNNIHLAAPMAISSTGEVLWVVAQRTSASTAPLQFNLLKIDASDGSVINAYHTDHPNVLELNTTIALNSLDQPRYIV